MSIELGREDLRLLQYGSPENVFLGNSAVQDNMTCRICTVYTTRRAILGAFSGCLWKKNGAIAQVCVCVRESARGCCHCVTDKVCLFLSLKTEKRREGKRHGFSCTLDSALLTIHHSTPPRS